MSEVPSNLIPTRITQLPYAPVASEESLLLIVYQGNTYQIMAGDLLQVAGVPTSRQVIAGTGLTGGGQLTDNVTLSIANGGVGTTQLSSTGVTAGQYGSATEIPVFSVDAKGRITAATTIPATVSGYVPTSREVIAGEGLNGGGPLNANVTLNVDLASATPLPGDQAGSAGSSTDVARADHVHPAVDLSDADEVDGILGLSNGGTAKSLVANAGAIIWSGADGLYVGPAGVAGQILQSNGTSQYVWVDQSGLDVGQADNLNGGAANRIAVQTAPDTTGFVSAPTVTDTFLKWNGSSLVWDAVAGAGTVTSVNASGGTTGMTFSGGPITAAGTLTLSGTLIPANGGTGISSYAVGDLLFANTTTSLDKLTVGSNGYLLASNGTAPAYVNPTSVTIGTATNLAGGAGGSIPYQSSAGTTTFLASGTGVLTASGGNPSYTMSPSLTQVTVAGDPTTNLQVATKQYVDTLVSSGITYHTPVKYEVPDTTGNLNATYNNGTAGVGATLTNAGTLGAFTPDGTVAQVGDRILIYNQTNAYENGVYTVTTVGSGSVAWVLTRSTDTDSYALKDPNGLGEGDAFFITSGATGAGETYVCNTSGTITFGTTAITFVQVSATQVYSAGTGLTLTGTTFSLTAPVATSLGGTGLSSFTSGGAVYATSTSALTTGTLPVTAGGTGATSLTSGYLVKGNGTSAASASVVYDDGTSVGVGTTSPGAKLDVNGLGWFRANSSANGLDIIGRSSDNSGQIRILTNNAASALATLASYGNDVALLNNTASYSLLLGTNGTERMRLDASGNVLIGTTAAVDNNFPLELNAGTSSVRGMGVNNNGGYGVYLTYDNTTRYATAGAAIRNVANSPLYFETNNTLRATLDASGNLGIGTSSPGNKLDIVSAGSSQIRVKDGVGATSYYDFGRDGTDGLFGFSGAQTTFSGYKWSVNAGTEVMRITNGGDVGIGTASPFGSSLTNYRSGTVRYVLGDGSQASDKKYWDILSSSGTLYMRALADADNNSTSFLTAERGGTGTNWIISAVTLNTAGAERMRVDSSGNVGIGTASPSTKLDVSGTVKATAFTGIDGGTF